ncbi:hypothetical protein, partial [uncultured Meiothermus sp.]|uniref:hypothetical protein n=1 Tax=uncultured Meiothermus sp. TaxID=157471 RepID=UPI002638CCE9
MDEIYSPQNTAVLKRQNAKNHYKLCKALSYKESVAFFLKTALIPDSKRSSSNPETPRLPFESW